VAIKNIKETIDDIAKQIQDPTVAANNLLSSFGEMPKALFKAKQEGKSLGDVLGAGLKNAGDFAAVLFSPAGLLIAGLARSCRWSNYTF
jgi:hypothetical protein